MNTQTNNTQTVENTIKCCIIQTPQSGKFEGKKIIMANCQSIEQAISLINNKTFKNSPINEGEGINFTSHTENNLYSIIEGNYKPSKVLNNGTAFL